MGTHERKVRDRHERERKIVDCARRMAESDGWQAVTTRRLAEKIEYSPPVLYGHFPDGKQGIVNAVALVGIRDFTRVARRTLDDSTGMGRIPAFIDTYLHFAEVNPATYEAMMSMQLGVRFAHESTPPELREAFSVFVAVLDGGAVETGDIETGDIETQAEIFWSALHGVCELTRGGRLSADDQGARRAMLAEMFSASVGFGAGGHRHAPA